jgi:hypothetical protein
LSNCPFNSAQNCNLNPFFFFEIPYLLKLLLSIPLNKLPCGESSLSGSMASLASGVIVPSLVNGHISGSGLVNGMMRHSLNGGHAGQGHQRPESRLSVQHRRSARGQLTRQDQQRLQEQQRLPEPLIDPSEHFSPGKLLMGIANWLGTAWVQLDLLSM